MDAPAHVKVGAELNGVGLDGATVYQAIRPVQAHKLVVGVHLVEVLAHVVPREHARRLSRRTCKKDSSFAEHAHPHRQTHARTDRQTHAHTHTDTHTHTCNPEIILIYIYVT